MLISMKNPWVRLAYITLCSVLVLTIIVFIVKIYSESLQHGAYNHPLVQQDSYLVISAKTPDLGPIGQLEFYQQAHKNWPEAFLEVPVQMSHDGTALVYPYQDLQKTNWGKGDVFQFSFDELKNMSSGKILTLETLVKALPESHLFIKVMDEDPAMFQPAVKVLEKQHEQNNIVIYSETMDSFHYVFQAHPQWVFAGGTIHLQQLRVLDAIFLPGLAKIKPDFFVITAENVKNQKLLTKSAVHELNRRFKRILFKGTKQEYEELPDWIKIKINGFLTTQPKYFSKLLEQY